MVTEKKRIRYISLGEKQVSSLVDEELALDEPVCIYVNDEYQVTLISTPEMQRELAVGYLLTGGIIESVDEIKNIELKGNNVMVELAKEVDLREASVNMMNLIVTACASSPQTNRAISTLPKVTSRLTVRARQLKQMITTLNKMSGVHTRTRGTHAAMLCSKEGETLALAEDVGRHNAVDKVIGYHTLQGGDLGDCILLSTGRQSGEMVQKACSSGIPVITSMTVPLISGIRLAEAGGVTLTSFSQGNLKVYTHSHRIKE
ncbi:MAG: formate dehydrogenase accessory sulfurtransferase FdhD [Candidatus Bathyarchaeota archaeon]|nr:formate dehydrogenase accessory sulfurtransferase FdhD [Candidatus Bathyarchaeota archaeon]